MEEYRKEYGIRVHQRLVHSIPACVCIANFLLSQVRLKRDFGKIIVVLTLTYGAFLYIFFERTGRVQYPFLDFRDSYRALLNLIGLCLAALALYQLAYYAHELFMRKYLIKIENEGINGMKGRRRRGRGDVQLQELTKDRESHSSKPLLLHED